MLGTTTPSSQEQPPPVAPDDPYKRINKGILKNENDNGIGINEETIKETAQPNLPVEVPTENIPNISNKTFPEDTSLEFVPKYFHPSGIRKISDSYNEYQKTNSSRKSQITIYQFEELFILNYIHNKLQTGHDIPKNNTELQLALFQDFNLENFEKVISDYEFKDSRHKQIIKKIFERMSRE